MDYDNFARMVRKQATVIPEFRGKKTTDFLEFGCRLLSWNNKYYIDNGNTITRTTEEDLEYIIEEE